MGPIATLQTLAHSATLPKMAASRILKTTLSSHKSIRLLKTACVTQNTCLHVPSPHNRTEDSPSLGASPLLRKSRIPTSLGQSCPSQPRRGWLLDQPDLYHGQHDQAQKKDGQVPASSHFQVLNLTSQQERKCAEDPNISTLCSESRF